jgi:regulator of sigma E protease
MADAVWYIPAILALGLLIIVHEGGHYIVARLCKMKVERFSLFFGPAILKFKRGDTTFQIGSIPLGGFVQITGMNPHDEVDENDPHVYPNRPAWQRFLAIFAGPGTNYVCAVVIWFLLKAISGTGLPMVLGVEPGMAAAQAGLEAGDTVVAIEGKRMDYGLATGFRDIINSSHGKPIHMTVVRPARDFHTTLPAFHDDAAGIWRIGATSGPVTDQMMQGVIQAVSLRSRADAIEALAIASMGLRNDDTLALGDGRSARLDDPAALSTLLAVGDGQAVAVTVRRAASEFPITLTPSYDPVAKRYRIGIGLSDSADMRARPGLGTALVAAVHYPVDQSREILSMLYKVTTRKEKGEVGGPVAITRIIQQSFKHSWVRALELLAMLNVYLGLFNLLPLPALDGGRLVFLGYEMVTRRRPNPRFEAAVHMVGFMVLFGIMIRVTFKDIFM